MNERIKELAKQADPDYTGEYNDEMGHALVGNDAIQKFAELIIQECLQLCKDAQTAYLMHGMSEREADGAISVQEYIKEHFGIENVEEIYPIEDIVEFYGVPLVRIININNKWQIQERDDETSDVWVNIGKPFLNKERAIDEAPILCEF